MAALPHIDEHSIAVNAPPAQAWAALGDALSRAFDSPRSARVAAALGCRDRSGHGSPLEAGASIPGFHVARAEPPSELALEGEHRFSRYVLVFAVDPVPGDRSRVRAATAAEFPGVLGTAYRLAVIGTRGHVLVVRRLLRAIRRRAERD